MRKVRDKKGISRLIILSAAMMCFSILIDVNAEEIQQKKSWKSEGESWFLYNESGDLTTGWQWIDGRWYFLSMSSAGAVGQMLTGWQWIDGRCYYLSEQTGENYLKGALYMNDKTPDGYMVGNTGAWIEENKIVEVPGKGIQTLVVRKTSPVSKTVFSGGSGGGGGSGRRKQSHNGRNNSENEGKESDTKPQPSKPTETDTGKNNSEYETPVVPHKQYKYTVRYMDIADKTTLKVMTGAGKEGETIPLIQPDIDGYMLCKGQKDVFMLSSDQITLNIYFEKKISASPSEARKIDWDLKFIEEGKPDREIFKGQKGKTEEGKELYIDFPETIIGNDQYYYHSLVPSPWSVVVNGNGTQKYYIEYRKGDHLPDEPDPDVEDKERLNYWLEVAKEADLSITGERQLAKQFITESQKEGNERLLNLVSMADGTDRKEVYVIAKGYTPNATVISQRFPAVKNKSELFMERLTIANDTYTILRVGFEKTYEESTCSHDYEVIDEVAATCSENGHLTVRCKKCGKEETVMLPAAGHVDADHDGICDVCYEPAGEAPEAVHYSIGDVQIRYILGKPYLFRCIDDDYEDAMENSQRLALFLCESVIRSDISGTSKKLKFGDNNNYKYSSVRDWLIENASDDFIHETYIGITKSYLGSTLTGAYEQFSESSLLGQSRLFQQLEDRVFILSVDEALKYRDYLWKFNGSDENNPESQISAYSKGYYLRTPQDSGMMDFLYGDGIYTVSLVDGNIRPVEVSETSIGIRPVMAVPQG
jgi:hypothetical protein